MAGTLLRTLAINFRSKVGYNVPRLSRGVGGDVVAPPSEHTTGMQVTIMNKEPDGGIMVDTYSPLGFVLNNGIRVVGPCVMFPKSVVHWNVAEADDITVESLELFTLLEPKLDILVIGKGERECKVSEIVLKYLRQHKINVEILPTDQACATFNFLNSERRVCAAAMIPPSYVEQYEDDIILFDQTHDQLTAKFDYHEIGEKLPDHLPRNTTPKQMIQEGARIANILLQRTGRDSKIIKETGHDYEEEPDSSQQDTPPEISKEEPGKK